MMTTENPSSLKPSALANGAEPFFEIAFRPEWDFIRVKIQRFWMPDVVQEYFSTLSPIMHRQRMRIGRARVLVDRRGGVPQSAETLDRTITWYGRTYQPGDSSAIVVDTSLLKLQLKRLYPGDRAGIFTSIDEAEEWLRTR